MDDVLQTSAAASAAAYASMLAYAAAQDTTRLGTPGFGLNDGSATIADQIWWTSPHVSPKQQHRFSAVFPVYMPMYPCRGRDTTALAKSLTTPAKLGSKLAGKVQVKVRDEDPLLEPSLDELALLTSEDAVRAHISACLKGTDLERSDKAKTIVEGLGLYKYFRRMNPGAVGSDKLTSDKLRLRSAEYLGVSFMPPNVQFHQGFDPESDAGEPRPNDELNTYSIGDATLQFVITPQDDLHFSLNLLFAMAAFAGESDKKSGRGKGSVELFPYYAFRDTELTNRTVIIKEYGAQQRNFKDNTSTAQRINQLKEKPSVAGGWWATAPVIGIHKLVDPIIKNVQFSDYTYGSNNLMRVTVTLGYGKRTGMPGFYSYEIRDQRNPQVDTPHLGESRYATDKTGYLFNKKEVITNHPNWMKTDAGEAKKTREGLTREHADRGFNKAPPLSPADYKGLDYDQLPERRRDIEQAMREKDVTKINKLLANGRTTSKSISHLHDEREGQRGSRAGHH
jgi:hypothetical protein